jgi:hypothetical protein
MPALSELEGSPKRFSQNGAPPHYVLFILRSFHEYFTDRSVEEDPRSPDLNPTDFAVGVILNRVLTE